MSQQEVYIILKKNPEKWMNATELNKLLKISTASANCQRLYKWNEIDRRVVKRGSYYEYEYRIKC